jgi:hypothetical protein
MSHKLAIFSFETAVVSAGVSVMHQMPSSLLMVVVGCGCLEVRMLQMMSQCLLSFSYVWHYSA